MKQYYLKVISKNEKSLNSFLDFLSKHLKVKFNVLQKSISARNNRKIVTLLKSPHVNKTAQEHFEYRIFHRIVRIQSSYLERDLVFLKVVLDKLFQDISIHLELITEKTQERRLVFHPDNFKLSVKRPIVTNFKREKQKLTFKELSPKKSSLPKLTKILNAYSVFGELLTTT